MLLHRRRKLWLRAISNIKVKLANAVLPITWLYCFCCDDTLELVVMSSELFSAEAPTPSSEDLEHYRQAFKPT